jgi:hypothetical protein
MAKQNLYEETAGRIVAAIEEGIASPGDYVLPWHQMASEGIPTNAVTGQPYRGSNVLWLWMRAMAKGYDGSSLWAGFKQWQKVGAQVRKGEQAERVLMFRPIEKKDKTGAPELDANGRPVTFTVVRALKVFHADQVDGFEAPGRETFPDGADELEHAEAVIRSTGASITHGGGNAYYRPATDEIRLPERERFHETGGYYATAFHELTHWTGHPSRLDRHREPGRKFGSEGYALEELTAQLGAAFTCAALGIESEPGPDHARYVAGWLEAIKERPRALVTAAAQASDAADYSRGTSRGNRTAAPTDREPAIV